MRLNVDFNLTKTTELYFGSDIYLSSQALPGQGASTDQLWDTQAKLTPLTIPVRYSTGELPTYKSGAKDVYSPYAMLNYTGLKNINTYSGTYTIRLQQDFSFLLRNLALNIQGPTATALILKRHVLSSPTCIGRNAGMRTEIWNLYTL